MLKLGCHVGMSGKEMMSQSEVYVFEVDKMVQGFVGLNDEYIEGIFVSIAWCTLFHQ